MLDLCKKYGKIFHWCRSQKIASESVVIRVLSCRIEQILMQKISDASDLEIDNINEMYAILWEYEPFVDIIIQFLINNFKINDFINRLYRDPSYRYVLMVL